VEIQPIERMPTGWQISMLRFNNAGLAGTANGKSRPGAACGQCRLCGGRLAYPRTVPVTLHQGPQAHPARVLPSRHELRQLCSLLKRDRWVAHLRGYR
jgi:hypothetical protein